MTADLAQAGKGGQDFHGTFLLDSFAGDLELAVVEILLLGAQIQENDFFSAGRQLGGHGIFGAADHDWFDQPGEVGVTLRGLIAIDEVVLSAQEIWVEKIHDGPEIQESVFDGSSGEGDGAWSFQ